ncbi:MAG: hypothetical protein IPG22_16745 [Acidobacteria bacterium]|nr:hypothetical protein [Acidobacteriota bacterium]
MNEQPNITPLQNVLERPLLQIKPYLREIEYTRVLEELSRNLSNIFSSRQPNMNTEDHE